MNILITGSNGFLGRNLCKQLSEKFHHNIIALNRQNCDLLDAESTKRFFMAHNQTFDLVIHTAIEGGNRNKTDTASMVYSNLLMLYNLLAHQQYFQCLISFGSGAELDRRYDINHKAINRYPVDPYGLSKSLIDKLTFTEEKLCNFRIYNCFGPDELTTRMIKNNIYNYIHHRDIIIDQNKTMDFFYIDDLILMLQFFIESNHIPKYFDCCYVDKHTLFDIATIINNLDSYKVNIKIVDPSPGKDYYGPSIKMPIQLIGLHQGIKIMYDQICKEYHEKN